MSTVSRWISGSAAKWVQIGVNMISRLALVPLYLTNWSLEIFGVWIAIQAITNVLSTLDKGHQTYLGYEFLRFGKNDLVQLSRYLWSGVGVGIIISFIVLVVIVIVIGTGLLPFLIGMSGIQDKTFINSAGLVLLVQGFTWLLCNSAGGLFIRALSPFGYYPRLSWWNVIGSITLPTAPAVSVFFGADILTAGIVASFTTFVFHLFLFIDIFRIFRIEKILFSAPSFKLGYNNFFYSIVLSGKELLESSRQQGVALILAPLTGAAGLTTFSTIRTVSNVALQGLNSITHPLMPELMRFLNHRDQIRSEIAFGAVWIVVIAFLAPAVVILQAFIEPLFVLWTQNQIVFDPLLFSILSLSVLVYAVAQPAIAVVVGNNLVKSQLIISIITATLVVAIMLVAVPFLGISGAGVALFFSEVVSTIAFRNVAQRWLKRNGLKWPRHASKIASASVLISSVAMGIMVVLPQYKWVILPCAVLLLLWNAWRYWNALPLVASQRIKSAFANFYRMRKASLNPFL